MEAVGWGIVFYRLNKRQFNVFVSVIIVNLPVHLSSTTISIIFCFFFVYMHVQKHTQKIPFGDGQLHRSIVVGCIGSIDNLRFCIQCICSYLGLKEWSKAWVHYCELYLSWCLWIIVLFSMYYGAFRVHWQLEIYLYLSSLCLCIIVLFRDALLWPVWGLRGPLATDPIACPRLSLLAEEGEEGDQELNRCHVFNKDFVFEFLSSLYLFLFWS